MTAAWTGAPLLHAPRFQGSTSALAPLRGPPVPGRPRDRDPPALRLFLFDASPEFGCASGYKTEGRRGSSGKTVQYVNNSEGTGSVFLALRRRLLLRGLVAKIKVYSATKDSIASLLPTAVPFMLLIKLQVLHWQGGRSAWSDEHHHAAPGPAAAPGGAARRAAARGAPGGCVRARALPGRSAL